MVWLFVSGAYPEIQKLLINKGKYMMKNVRLYLLVLMLCLPMAGNAHHSFEVFDRDNPIQIAGVIREFQWVNPHTWVQLLVTDPQTGEVVEWSIEGRSPIPLSRRGWTRNTLLPGEEVTLTIYPHKNGGPVGAIVTVVKADGTVINADTPETPDPDEEGQR